MITSRDDCQVQEVAMEATQTGATHQLSLLMVALMIPKQNMKHHVQRVELREKVAANKLQFSSANSREHCRLVPQIVNVYAYAQLVQDYGEYCGW